MTDKITKLEDTKIALLQDPEGTMERLRNAAEMLEGEGMSPWDLPEIGIPAGGGTTWEITTVDGDQSTKELIGVILDNQPVRQYYANPFEGGNEPPDCASPDGRTGIGNPGGNCDQCPFAVWGSDPKGAGQACGQRRHMLLLTEYSSLPVFFNVPPSSLKPLKQYIMGLLGAERAFYQVLTRITLEKTKSGGGIDYSRAVFARVQNLDEQQAAIALEYRNTVRGLLTRRITEAPKPAQDIDVDDYTTADE